MTEKMKALLLDGVATKCAELLEAAGFEVVQQKSMAPGELMSSIGQYDALAIRGAT